MSKKVVAYLRKSSADNRDNEANKQLNSFEYQRKVVSALIEKNELDLIHKPFEDDHTGYVAFARDGFEQMIRIIQEKSIDGIVCYDLSRLARNFGDGGLILWYLQSGKIKAIYTHDKVFTDSHSDQLMVAINFAIAKNSSDQTSDKTKRGIKEKVASTGHPHYPPILGYLGEGKSGQRLWVTDPETAPLILKVFETYSSGAYSMVEITELAYTIGLRSNNKRTRMSKNTIRNRLMDLAYTGVFIHDNQKIAGKYTPIIEPELYYKVQDVLLEKSHPKSEHFDYAFTGLITCSHCQDPLSGTAKKGNVYYRCAKRRNPCKSSKKVAYLNEKIVLDLLSTALLTIEVNNNEWKALHEYSTELNNQDKANFTLEARKASTRISEAEEQLKEVAKARLKKEITQKTHDLLTNDAEQQIKVFTLRREKYLAMVVEIDKSMKSFLENIHLVGKRFSTASEVNQRAIVSTLCENLTWNGEKFRWDWKKPYFFVTKTGKSSTMLPD